MNMAEQLALIKRGLGYRTLKRPPAYWLDTRSVRLNSVLGSPDMGAAYGKLILLCGDYSSGKTLLGNMLLGLAQADGAEICKVDVENSHDPVFEKQMCNLDYGRERDPGVYERIALIRPEIGIFTSKSGRRKHPAEELRLQTAEQLFQIAEKWMLLQRKCNPNGRNALMVDSTTAIVPEEELVAGITDQNMRTRMSPATFLNMVLKRWQNVALNTNTLLILISQIRLNPMEMFGNPERIPGGKGMVFYPHVIAQLRRANKGGQIRDENDDVIGLRSTIRNLKNKVGGRSLEGNRCGIRMLFKHKQHFKFMSFNDVKI